MERSNRSTNSQSNSTQRNSREQSNSGAQSRPGAQLVNDREDRRRESSQNEESIIQIEHRLAMIRLNNERQLSEVCLMKRHKF